MSEQIPPGETREVIADADPRGSYRLSVESGRVIIGKTMQEAARKRGDKLSKFNYARVKVGEASESVWVHNPTDDTVQLNIRKSGFLLDFFGSTTSESPTERDEREGRIVSTESTVSTVDPEGVASNVYTVDVASDNDAFPNDTSKVLLTAAYVQSDTPVADPSNVNIDVERYYGTFNVDWAISSSLEDRLIQIPDGARPVAKLDDDYHFTVNVENNGFDQIDLFVRLVFRIID